METFKYECKLMFPFEWKGFHTNGQLSINIETNISYKWLILYMHFRMYKPQCACLYNYPN